MKTIYLIVGRSGSGKSTIVNEMCKRHNLTQVVSYTTRPRRDSEVDGADHIFITDDEVFDFSNEIVAYTRIGAYQYFTTKTVLNVSDIYTIDPNGVKYLKGKNLPYKYVVIYIYCEESERQRRLMNRGDNYYTAKKRFDAENKQFKRFELEKAYDYMLDNSGDIESVLTEFGDIIRG